MPLNITDNVLLLGDFGVVFGALENRPFQRRILSTGDCKFKLHAFRNYRSPSLEVLCERLRCTKNASQFIDIHAGLVFGRHNHLVDVIICFELLFSIALCYAARYQSTNST